MKKYFLALFLLVVLVLPVASQAITVAELKAQIAALQAQLDQLLAQQNDSSSSCPSIGRNLRVGSVGMDVHDLQKYLIEEGLLDYKIPTTYFDSQVKNAVINWQKAHHVSPANGYFGSVSRAVLKELCNNSNNNSLVINSITNPVKTDGQVTITGSGFSKTGGNVINIGDKLKTSITSADGTTLKFSLLSRVPAGTYPVWVERTSVGKSNVVYLTIDGNSNNPILNISLDPTTPVAQSVVNGQKNVVLTNFSIGASNGDALINQISVGVTPVSGARLVENIRIYDGGTLLGSIQSLSITHPSEDFQWGSVNFPTLTIRANSKKIITIKADIASTGRGVIQAGIVGLAYPVTVPYQAYGLNVFGNQIGVSSTATPQPSITVLSPNGGESYQLGSGTDINWSGPAGYYDIFLTDKNGFGKGTITFSTYVNGGTANRYHWDTRSLITESDVGNLSFLATAGEYKVRVVSRQVSGINGYSISDASDGYFTLTNSTVTQPSLTVLSPNGGETFTRGDSFTSGDFLSYRFEVKGVTSGGNTTIELVSDDGKRYWLGGASGWDPRVSILDSGSVRLNDSFPAGKYVLLAKWTGYDGISLQDESNNSFTIVSSSSDTLSVNSITNPVKTDGQVTITGRGFSKTGGNVINIGDKLKTSITSADGTTLKFSLLSRVPAGTYPVWVERTSVGKSNIVYLTIDHNSCQSYHPADSNHDWKIDNIEIRAYSGRADITVNQKLRATQFFNSAGYKCQTGTEDGFAPIPKTATSASKQQLNQLANIAEALQKLADQFR